MTCMYIVYVYLNTHQINEKSEKTGACSNFIL